MTSKIPDNLTSLIQLLAAQESRITRLEKSFQLKLDILSSQIKSQQNSSCKNCLIKHDTNTNLLKIIDKLAIQIISTNNKLNNEIENNLLSCQASLNRRNNGYMANNAMDDQDVWIDLETQYEMQSENVKRESEKLRIDDSGESEPDTVRNELNSDVHNSENEFYETGLIENIIPDQSSNVYESYNENITQFKKEIYHDTCVKKKKNQSYLDEQCCSGNEKFMIKKPKLDQTVNATKKIFFIGDNFSILQASEELNAQRLDEFGKYKDPRTFRYCCVVKDCDFESKFKDCILRHTLSHNRHKAYGCIKCGHTTKLIRILKQHYLKCHNNTMQNSDIIFYKPNDDTHFIVKHILPCDTEFTIRQKYEDAVRPRQNVTVQTKEKSQVLSLYQIYQKKLKAQQKD